MRHAACCPSPAMCVLSAYAGPATWLGERREACWDACWRGGPKVADHRAVHACAGPIVSGMTSAYWRWLILKTGKP